MPRGGILARSKRSMSRSVWQTLQHCSIESADCQRFRPSRGGVTLPLPSHFGAAVELGKSELHESPSGISSFSILMCLTREADSPLSVKRRPEFESLRSKDRSTLRISDLLGRYLNKTLDSVDDFVSVDGF